MDVEASLAASTTAQETNTETTATPEVASPGATPTDVEQGGQRQSESVPYDRFQQVNSELSELKSAAKSAGFDNPRDYLQALQEAAAVAQYGETETEDADPVQAIQQQLGQLQEVFAEQLFNSQFPVLQQQFPQADAAEVREALIYGRAKDLQAAMKQNHERNEAKRQRYLADYNRTNQQRQNGAVEGSGGGSTQSGADIATMPRDQFMKIVEDRIAGRV